MKSQGIIKFLLIGIMICSVLGCQATRRGLNFETAASITLTAENDVNPDMDGRSSPVVIRIFKLTDARQFQREEFLNLYENASERLGNDLIDTIVLKELIPGESREEKISLTPDVRYLGFLGEFMQYQKANSVIVIPIQEHNKNKIDIRALRLSLIDTNNPTATRQQSSSSVNDGRSRDSDPRRNYPDYDQAKDTIDTVNSEKEFWDGVRER